MRVPDHAVPIDPGLLHTLVEAVSTAVDECLDARDHLLCQAIDVVAANAASVQAAASLALYDVPLSPHRRHVLPTPMGVSALRRHLAGYYAHYLLASHGVSQLPQAQLRQFAYTAGFHYGLI